MNGRPTPSSELLAAQARLHQLRAEAQAARLEAGLPVGQYEAACQELPWGDVSWNDESGSVTEAEVMETAVAITELPSHLGWGSAAVNAVKAISRIDVSKRRVAREQGAIVHWEMRKILEGVEERLSRYIYLASKGKAREVGMLEPQNAWLSTVG